MEGVDEGADEAAAEAELELHADPEALWRSLVSDEEYPVHWSESVWTHDAGDVAPPGALLFVDPDAEAELRGELRLAELWGLCDGGQLAMAEFFELSALIAQVQGLPGALCVDCDMLHRPNVSPNWALATTTLCRAHLRFRLSHARIDGGSSRR
jgi:hypothetical protein